MLVEQFVGERPDRLVAERLRALREVVVPGRAGRVQHASGEADVEAAAIRLEPEIMAHPDIMVDRPAIAELQAVPQHPRRAEVVEIVIAGRDPEPVLGHQRVARRKHRARTVARDPAQLRPAFGRSRERGIRAAEAGRHHRHEHPVDVAGPHRILAVPPPGQSREVERNRGIFRSPLGMVPQPDIPAPGRAGLIPPLDGQGRPVHRVERPQAAAAPPEGKPAAPEIALGLVGEQGMVEAVLGLPDQPRQIVRLVEDAIDPKRIRPRRHHRGHHRPREIDGPEARVEALHERPLPRRPGRRQPMSHH